MIPVVWLWIVWTVLKFNLNNYIYVLHTITSYTRPSLKMLQFWQFSSRMHHKPPQSTHKIQNFLGGMPSDPLEVVGPRAHHVPWLAPTSRYAYSSTDTNVLTLGCQRTLSYSAKVWQWKTLTNGQQFVKVFPTNLYLLMFLLWNPRSICQSFTRQTFVNDSFVKVFPVKFLC